MHKRFAETKQDTFASPKGNFGAVFRELFTVEETGCPFDLEHVTIAPGKRNFPFHSHGAMWEMYYVLSGTATMRTDEETVKVEAGDGYLCPPGMAHQIINETDEDVTYLVIANEPPFDACYYPDSGKLMPRAKAVWKPMPEAKRFWRADEEATYFTGEE